MKFTNTLFALMTCLTVTKAAPADEELGCDPGTYQCDGTTGWEVCDTRGIWVFAGDCPPDTVCKFFEGSKSPYCVPPNFKIY
ncbi:uncharacterized protein B0J16DRAFT_416783 [Fusarium flagelliforme]|uniref:Uncharacterized protein n=1 Tax=Fusarium flagelliforme TaxID=2675880 RepID=A0A395M721_9HYPO|nr:uncharacterized protein B0J16DRAFT_416783 [Fusarium flagelliforme]KAH7179062.1 hypothetical protein B0J16DRAFT_416783 [Fusarium flagelliforme]RFN43654.1 hypothetical protein FIE12Z_12120 [Fusarium flagelliforme]